MIELVVFDMAGTTLYDGNAVSDCFRAALSAVGVHPDQNAVNRVMGFPKPEAIRTLVTAAQRSCTERELDAVHADFVRRMSDYYATNPAVREIPGASAVFATLRGRGIKVALNTGFNRAIVDVILGRLGWTKVVDATVASDEVARGRPYPYMIFRLMNQLEVLDSRHVAKVGDTPVDLEEGHNAGCSLVIGVTTGSFTREELLVHRHTHLVDSVSGVAEIVLKTHA